MISFDFSGLLDEVIGAGGISRKDIEAMAPAIEKAHSSVIDSRKNGKIEFFDLPSGDMIESTIELASRLEGRFSNIVVLGIGGSSLGPRTLYSALNGPVTNITSGVKTFFLDNVDPVHVHDVLSYARPEETLYIVTSKSGTTAETASQFLVVRELIELTSEKLSDHLVFITDPEKGILRSLSEKYDVPVLEIPPAVGGRFSVLTPVGLLPAALGGADIKKLAKGASAMSETARGADIDSNPALLFAATHFLASARGINISVLMPYASSLYDLADWYRQLWAESLGKETSLSGKTVFCGQTPVKALGATDQHSQVQLYMEGPFDKIINFITVGKFERDMTIPEPPEGAGELSYLSGHSFSELINAEARGTMAALAKNSRMTTHTRIDAVNEETIGALFMFFEAATAYAGALFDIDPYDQPGVELGKKITFGLMGRAGFEDMARVMKSVEDFKIEI